MGTLVGALSDMIGSFSAPGGGGGGAGISRVGGDDADYYADYASGVGGRGDDYDYGSGGGLRYRARTNAQSRSSGYGHGGSHKGGGYGHSGGGHKGGYGSHSGGYHSGHSGGGYGHSSGGYGKKDECCPLVVDALCLAAILGAIAGAALLLNQVIMLEITPPGRRKRRSVVSYIGVNSLASAITSGERVHVD